LKLTLTFRFATQADCPLLAELNHQLIRDEGHRNRMTVPELTERMRGWLAGEYRVVIFLDAGKAEVRPEVLGNERNAAVPAVLGRAPTAGTAAFLPQASGRTREMVAYALFREQVDEIYLRQLFVVRNRRRQGIGRKAVEILRSQIWPKNKRLTVEVLVANQAGIAFWRA
jgi:GNAT superfamily N-acetyltransferase